MEELVRINQRREAIEKMIGPQDSSGNSPAVVPALSAGLALNTMDMARTVIRNAGHPLSIQQICDDIEKTYGVRPAKTMADMLWKRARAGKGFFKDDSGLIGVSDALPKIRTVHRSQTPTGE